jgi:hypothetical protein
MIRITAQVDLDLQQSESADLEELYTDYQKGLEEFLSEHNFRCFQCQTDINEISKVKNHLSEVNKK